MFDKRLIAGLSVAMAMFAVGCDEKKGDPKPGDKPAAPAAPAGDKPADKPATEAPKPTEPVKPVAAAADPVVGIWVLDVEAAKKAALAGAKAQKGADLSADELKQFEAYMAANAAALEIEIVLKADGTGSMKAGGETKTGKWKKEGDVYTIASDDKPDDTEKFKLEGGMLKPVLPPGTPDPGVVLKRK